jgi:EAL domain-containing protein (putative c-di-GMP-specific phosphodiesterase class I)
MGCEFGQGYLFARPVDGATFVATAFGRLPEAPPAPAATDAAPLALPQANLRSA